MDKVIGISSAAKLLGVSISTLKRLCDEQMVPSVRTHGGHRRFDRAEVESLGQKLVGQAVAMLDSQQADHINQLVRCLVTGDEGDMVELVHKLCIGKTLASVLDQYLLPAIKQVASDPAISSVALQLARGVAARILDRLSAMHADRPSAAPIALGGTLGNSLDIVTSKMVEATLRSARVPALHLECRVDIVQLARAAAHADVRTVWLAHLHESPTQLIETGRHLRSLLPSSISLFLFSGSQVSGIGKEVEIPLYTSLQTIFLRESSRCIPRPFSL